MAKIGTAQIEIAPHINDAALDLIAQKVADAVERGIRRGMAAAFQPSTTPYIAPWTVTSGTTTLSQPHLPKSDGDKS